MKANLLSLLAISSFVVLVNNSVLIYLCAQGALLAFVAHRLVQGVVVSSARLGWALVLPLVFLVNVAASGGELSLDYSLRVINFSLIILVARMSDVYVMINSVRWLLYLNGFVAVAVYLNLLPNFFAGHVYQYIALMGRPINSGLIFEANYSAISMGLLAFLWANKFKHHLIVLGSMTLFTFRTGFLIPIIALVGVLGSRFLLLALFASWCACLTALYLYFPILLEQRWYIWSGFFQLYEPSRMYTQQEVQHFMAVAMEPSPWGQSGLNLHSGVFESLLYKGLFYSVFSGWLMLISLLFLPQRLLALLIYLLIIATIFSLSLGGLNLVSLVFSFMVAACLDKQERAAREPDRRPLWRLGLRHKLSYG